MKQSAEQGSQISVSRTEQGKPDDLKLLRLFLGITLVLGILAVLDQRQYADEIAVWAVSPYWRSAIAIGWALVSLTGLGFILTWTSSGQALRNMLDRCEGLTARLGLVRFIVIVALSVVFPVAVLGTYGRFVLPFFTRLLIFWLLVCVSAWFAQSYRPSTNPLITSSAIALIFGVVYRTALFSADVSTYPFSLGWSEGSRYYYASLFFAKQVYGLSIPPSVLHPTRYLLQSLPFLVPEADLYAHRLWQVVLWVGMTGAVGIALAWRLHWGSSWMKLLLACWAYLFLFQGPVWYHLSVMVIFVLWLARTDRAWLTLTVVIIASLWAGVSRVNWIPVPGMLAALLYFLEHRRGQLNLSKYLAWPALWFLIGSAVGFASQWVYIVASGNETSRFGSSLSSPLLWYRLFPSATYPLGVLPGILLASLPLLLFVIFRLVNQPGKLHAVRLLGISVILAALLSGGIIVSVKIGGGSNLHNMDAFLVALMILGAYAVTDSWQMESSRDRGQSSKPIWLTLMLISMPVFFAIGMGRPIRSFSMSQAERSLARLQSIVEQVANRGGEVLFISQRHLLTFGQVEDVDIIPEYETVFLMEMAMSGNRDYLDEFHRELRNQRFDLIIVDRLSTQFQAQEHNFAEENNAWVSEVSAPILCAYEPIESVPYPSIQFFAPLEDGSRCDG